MKLHDHIIIIVLSFLLSAIFTYPFITKLPTHYNDGSDYGLNGYILSYDYNSLISGRIFNQESFFNGRQFYPQPYTLTYSDHRFIPSVVFSIPHFVTQDLTLSVNILTFLSFVLSFLSSFYVINFLVKNKWASIVGAVVFTFNPITFIRFPVHLDLLSKYFLPPMFLFCLLFLKKPQFKNALFFFLFFTLNALTVIYYQIFSIIIFGIIFSSLILYEIFKKNFSYIFKIIKYGLVSLIFLPLLLYFDKPFLDFSNQEMVSRSVNVSIFLSARLIDWFMPSPRSVFYGDFVKSFDQIRNPKDQNGFSHGEHTLGLNILPMILFILAFFYFFTKEKKSSEDNTSLIEVIKSKNKNRSFIKLLKIFIDKLIKFPYLFFLAVLIISFFLTLGPYFTGWNETNGIFKLPYSYLYDFTPLLKGIRVPSRAQFIFYVPFSLFVSFGALYILQKFKKLSILIIFLMILILFAENYQETNLSDTSEILSQFYSHNLKKDLSFLRDKRTIHYPPFAFDFNKTNLFPKEIYYLNWAGETDEILMNGNSGYFPPDQIKFLGEVKKNLNEDVLRKLVSLNIDYLIIHKDLFDKEDKINFEVSRETLFGGLIWKNEQIDIIDLKKLNISPKICDFNKDININFTPVFVKELNTTILAAIIKNKSDCYYPSIYQNKYKVLDFYVNFIHHQVKAVFPVMIGPKEEVTISELTNNLKVIN